MTSDGATSLQRRAVDWYELFFDLVFVAVIALAAHLIEQTPTFGTVVVFTLLLFPLWWAWVNLMLGNNLFGARSSTVGVLMIAAMPGPAAMAIALGGGIESHAWLYAFGAVWVRFVLLVMWLIPHFRRETAIPLWRPLVFNLGTALLWLVSIAVPAPYQYLLWALAVGVEVLLLAVRGRRSVEVYERASISHSLERVGLFVVIVIGESVYLSVTGLAEHPSIAGAAAALCGFVVCALLARAFFHWGVPNTEAGLVSAQRSRSYAAMRDVVMYLPFLLIVGLTLVAASVGIAVAEAGEPLGVEVRMLLAGGIAVFYATNALVGVRLGRRLSRIAILLVPGVAIPALACAMTGGLPGWVTLALVASALAVLDLVGTLLDLSAHKHSTPPLAVR